MLEPIDIDVYENDELKHWGILGMKWGIRRFQNEDGSLTPEGRERYGVKTAAETKKLSYSQDYESLKAKKNRTEKENEKLKRLEEGKKHFEKSTFDKNYWEKLKDNNTYDYIENAAANYSEYLKSTNYGKGMAKVEAMMAIPTTAIGMAADAGAIYLQLKAHSPFVLAGLGTTLGYGSGMTIADDIYTKNNEKELKNELIEKNGEDIQGTYYSDKKPAKLKNNQIYDDWTGMTYSTRPLTKSDISANDSLKDVMDLFGVTEKDLVIDENEYSRVASVFRKDGKPFVWKDRDGRTYQRQDLRYIEEEDDWFDDKNFKPVNKKRS